MSHSVKQLIAIRDSDLPIRIDTIGVYSRIKVARGECRSLAYSSFQVLERHFPDNQINYFFEGGRHYFLVEDELGVFYEIHVYIEEES